MNTLKFQNRNKIATEQHDLKNAVVETYNLLGKEVQLYVPCNLNISITTACHNKCGFCIDKDNVHDNICDDVYYRNLEHVLDALDPDKFEITITGGEPTLNRDRLLATMHMCHEKGFKCRTFSSTGIHMMDERFGEPICKKMVDEGFIHNINISRMCIDDEKSNTIFGNANNITNEDIERLVYFFNCNGAEMRLSCNLMKGYVDSMDKVKEYVHFYRERGVESFIFRELVGDFDYAVKLKDIIPFNEFRTDCYLTTVDKFYYKIDVFAYDGMIVKHYTDNPISKDIVGALSYRNGILRNGFKGDIIYG